MSPCTAVPQQWFRWRGSPSLPNYRFFLDNRQAGRDYWPEICLAGDDVLLSELLEVYFRSKSQPLQSYLFQRIPCPFSSGLNLFGQKWLSNFPEWETLISRKSLQNTWSSQPPKAVCLGPSTEDSAQEQASLRENFSAADHTWVRQTHLSNAQSKQAAREPQAASLTPSYPIPSPVLPLLWQAE